MTGTSRKVSRPERIWALDGLRGLAALAVVAYHYLYRAAELYPDQLGAPQAWIQWGSYGVQLFFLISGFVIFDSARRSSVSRFLFNRAVRIYPAFWICAALVTAVIALRGLPGRDGLAWWEIVLNFTLAQGFLDVAYIDGAWWTLAVEILFYGQIALLARLGLLSPGRVASTMFIWLLLTVAARVAIVVSGAESVAHFSGTLYWTGAFLIGVGVNLALSGRKTLGSCLAVASLASMMPGNLDMLVPMLSASVLLVVAAVVRLPERWRKLSDFLGELSYPLYLLHQNIGYIALLALASVGLSLSVSALITLTAVAGVATAVAYLIDRPIREKLRRMYAERCSALVGAKI